MKKIIALLLGIIIVISNRNCSLRVYAESSSDALYSQEEYDGFELCWINNGERDILLSATNGKGQISFVYDELGRRISKTGMDGKVTSFAYDDLGRLAYEEREEHIFFLRI